MDAPGSSALPLAQRHHGMAAAAPYNPQQTSASPPAMSQRPLPPMVANNIRLKMIAKRLHLKFAGRISLDPQELFYLVISLARCIDYAISHNDIPERGLLHCLSPIIKQVYQCQNQSDTSLQTAIMVLMIAVKNACSKEWFPNSDVKELLGKTNQLYSSFCMSVSNTIVGNAQVIIYKILPRFYPQYKFHRVIVSLEAKPGYDVLVADFYIQRTIPPDERICLLVAQMDNLETSSCIINPQHVSFLVNGKGVARRTNSSMDSGPQFPSDITSMLKYGMNIIQAIGYFTGNYVIAIASLSMIATPTAARLEDYVQPVTQNMVSDSDIIEGPSRISLNCPISFKRIKTPVKGRLCNHHQCFDYDNFMELNSRKPSWRCPCCNSSTSCIELRIDQKIVKVLQEVGEDETDIVIFSNGSWKTSFEYHQGVNQLHGGKSGKGETSMENDTVTSADVVNLVMEENCLPDRAKSLDRGESGNSELEDRKPFRESEASLDPLYNSSVANTSMQQAVTCHTESSICPASLVISDNARGTLESLVPSVLLNPAHADAIPPAENQGTTDFGVSHASVNFNYEPRLSNISESMPLQSLHAISSITTNEAGRSPIPNVSRIPTITHALPSQTPSFVSLPRLQTATPSGLNSVTDNVQFNGLARSYVASTAMRSTALGHRHQSYTAVQQVANLPAANHISTQAPPTHLRGVGAYRGNNQSQRRHSFTNPSSASHSSQVQQPSTNPAHSIPGQTSCNTLPSAQRAAQATSSQLFTARIPSTREGSFPQLDIGGPLPSVLDHLSELPIEENWRPTGRMRGSLTGSAYQSALNQYMVTQTSQAPIPPFSASVSTNEERPSIANMISCQVPMPQNVYELIAETGNPTASSYGSVQASEWMTDFRK